MASICGEGPRQGHPLGRNGPCSVQHSTSNWIQPLTLWMSLEADLPRGEVAQDHSPGWRLDRTCLPTRTQIPDPQEPCGNERILFAAAAVSLSFNCMAIKNYIPHRPDTLLSVPKTLKLSPHYISFRYTHDSVLVYTVKMTTINLAHIHHHT